MTPERQIQTAEELVRRFGYIGDAELSLADIQWLTRNIREWGEARDAARAEQGKESCVVYTDAFRCQATIGGMHCPDSRPGRSHICVYCKYQIGPGSSTAEPLTCNQEAAGSNPARGSTTTSADSGKGADVTARADNGQESDKRQDGAVMLSSTARQSESVGASASTSTGPVPPSGRGASTGKGAEVCSPTSADVGIAKGNPATAAPDSLWPELKGAASPPAAPPPDEAVQAAPEEIGEGWLPPDLETPDDVGWCTVQDFCEWDDNEDLGAAAQTTAGVIERRDSAWRAALRAERGRAEQWRARHWELHDALRHEYVSYRAQEERHIEDQRAKRAAADARVRAVYEAALPLLVHGHAEAIFKDWWSRNEPALAVELGGGEGEGDA